MIDDRPHDCALCPSLPPKPSAATAAFLRCRWRQELSLSNAISGNKEHGLTCKQLPTADVVKQTLAEHQDIVQQILDVNPGNTFLDVDRETCPEKADIVISLSRPATVRQLKQSWIATISSVYQSGL